MSVVYECFLVKLSVRLLSRKADAKCFSHCMIFYTYLYSTYEYFNTEHNNKVSEVGIFLLNALNLNDRSQISNNHSNYRQDKFS